MPLSEDEILNRSLYHAPTAMAKSCHESVSELLRSSLRGIESACPDSREKSVAITHCEEAFMWANASIARNHDKL